MRTQKAKGIINGIPELLSCISSDRSLKSFKYLLAYINNEQELITEEKDIEKDRYYPVFARPCPVEPRHGFVDSIKVYHRKALKALWKRVLKEDPNGEIILSKSHSDKIDTSFVFSIDGHLSIGLGSDGATSGKESILLPVAPEKIKNSVYKKSGLKAIDNIFLEGIRVDGLYSHWDLVQIRGGPSLGFQSEDFVPKKIKVKKVIFPSINLLEWSDTVASIPEGTVVYGAGHTITSHAAIHCIIHKIPFITTFKPKVGETLLQTENKTKNLDREEFCKGISAADNLFLKENDSKSLRERMIFGFAVLHNWSYIRKSQHASWLLGAASATLVKLFAAVCMGEYRHKEMKLSRNEIYQKCRNEIYQKLVSKDGLRHIQYLPKMCASFFNERWRPGYGGQKWGKCAANTILIYNSMFKIYNKKSKQIKDSEIVELLNIINRVTNLVHNGGWWLNKFAEKKDLDFVSKHPGFALMITSHIIYNVFKSKDCTKAKLIDIRRGPVPFKFDRQLARIKLASMSANMITVKEEGSPEKTIPYALTLWQKQKILYAKSIRKTYLFPTKKGFKTPFGKEVVC